MAEGKVEAQLQSVFFSAIDPSPTQIERLNRVHELLVSRLPAKYRNLAMRTTISVGDPSLLEGGRSAHRIMMATNDAGHIIVSPMVLRAGYSYCSSLAAQISSMSETLLATSGDERVASTRVADTLRRNHELVVRAERIARVRAWSTSFEPTMTKEYVKKNLRDAIAAYDECVVMVFAMPMAHELAHVYLGRQSDDRIQLYLDERGCDCAAAAHVETIRVGRVGWRANDYYKLFAKTFADAVVFFPEKILPEGSQTSKLLLARFTALGTIDQCSKYEDLMNAFGLVLWPGRQVP
ncbi:hypothetical protein [Ottowia sp.]|uniref:hypothetical protein n=1 Tax=Ottowia sp. TaxID=1898956 RepID=UPI0025D7297B|nr:hypothetical protein [Ottowia sp.]MBK6747922.1 hypothetical protein [Ottowia sp.]